MVIIMKPETLKALNASIKHWERLVAGTQRGNESPWGDYCALCKLFNHPDQVLDTECAGCPVKERTGHEECINSPWKDAATLWKKPGFHAAAIVQLEFLKSLRPKP